MTSLLPNPEQTFFSIDGLPLVGGQVFTFTPGTLSPKMTWVDSGQVTANANPITLDSAGRCICYGTGDYRMQVYDALGNLQYDQLTSAYLDDSAISSAMLPVVGAATLATAWALISTPFLQDTISAIQLMTGPTGPVGGIGPAGPAGPQGNIGASSSYSRQGFNGSGTCNIPQNATFALWKLWGSGGGGSSAGGGGGGGFSFVWHLVSDLPASVNITIGNGGLRGTTAGNDGTMTSVDDYIYQAGGLGGYTSPVDGSPVTGASGYLSAIDTGLTIIQIYQQLSQIPVASVNNGIEPYDRFGNMYGSLAGAGSPGQDINNIGPFPVMFGGQGGIQGNNGSPPGGGGGGGANGAGDGTPGQVVVDFF